MAFSRAIRFCKWAGTAICFVIASLAMSDFSIKNDANIPIGLNAIGRFLIPFVVVLLPTAYLWWRDLPFPRGFCHVCGYDLTGNVSETCSECGTSVLPVKDQPDLPCVSLNQCRKCGCDLTGRFTGHCPDCGATTPEFPPGHCAMCGYSITEQAPQSPWILLRHRGWFCIFCKNWHEQRYPPGYCQYCGCPLDSNSNRCGECGTWRYSRTPER